MKNIAWIDWLKGIAMCAVIMTHTGAAHLPAVLGKIGEKGGAYGVQIFLIISGYLSYISLEKFYLGKHEEEKIFQWYIKKFLRLLPLYYLALIIYTLLWGGYAYWLGSEGVVTYKNLFMHILFLHGLVPHYANSVIGGEWYIGVLAIMYLLLPLCYNYINSLEKAIFAFVISIWLCQLFYSVSSLLIIGKDAYIYDAYLGVFAFIPNIPAILEGIILYFALRSTIWERLKKKELLGLTILSFSLIEIVGQILGKNKLFGMRETTLLGIWIMGIAVSQSLVKCSIMNNKVIGMIGKLSLPMYLFHMHFIQLYEKYLSVEYTNIIVNWCIKYTFVLLGSFLTAYFLTRFYEKPLIEYLEKKVLLLYQKVNKRYYEK